MTPQNAPCGSWQSPITADMVAAGSIAFVGLVLDGDTPYWIEQRPAEGGRHVVVMAGPDGLVRDAIPAPYSARTRVHEYGGGAYTVDDGVVYFSNFSDGGIYCCTPGDEPIPIAFEPGMRFADFLVDRRRHRLIAVREDHTDASHEPVNSIVAVDLDTGAATTLASGADFYSSPRLSPEGERFAWLAWNHPNMPWDGTELQLAALDDGGLPVDPVTVAGGASVSIFQPEWSPSGELYFVSDESGWWNIHRLRDGAATPVAPMAAEFGRPQWGFGMSTYGFRDERTIICAFARNGFWSLASLDVETAELREIPLPYTEIERYLCIGTSVAVMIAGAPAEPASVVRLDLASLRHDILRRSGDLSLDPAYLSPAVPIEFPTTGGTTAYGFYYQPCNPGFDMMPGEVPPLLVRCHGGPTSATTSTLSLLTQFWTSRGFALLDVNYGGSTGFGRRYRERLDGMWGVVDVEDAINGALYLADCGDADPRRLAISGGSAGGYTVLSALTFHDVFSAGASYYGVSDIIALFQETHKFESRYDQRLIGPYPEKHDLYLERSPINHVDRLSKPIIFFQGTEDRVVPQNQAERMVDAMKANGIPVAYILFPGESHGFRRAENIIRALEAELAFYGAIFGFTPADRIEPVTIENFGSRGA